MQAGEGGGHARCGALRRRGVWCSVSMRDAVVNTCKRDLGPLQGRPSLFKRGSNRAFIDWYEVKMIQYEEILFKLISYEK